MSPEELNLLRRGCLVAADVKRAYIGLCSELKNSVYRAFEKAACSVRQQAAENNSVKM